MGAPEKCHIEQAGKASYNIRLSNPTSNLGLTMTHTTPTTVIDITVRQRGGSLFACSADMFGLNIVAADAAQLRDRLTTALKWLYKQNQNVDVEVLFPSTPAEFPRANPANQESVAQLVIAAAA